MPDYEFLPSIRDSETVTCQRCNARQYPRNGTCIRCHTPLRLDYLSLDLETLLNPGSEDHKKQLARGIGTLLRALRNRRGICQSQLTVRAEGCVTRTNLSRAECGRTLLPLNKLLPLAKALGLTAVILRFEVPISPTTRRSNGQH